MSLRVWGGQCGAQSCDKADLKAGICFGGFRSKKRLFGIAHAWPSSVFTNNNLICFLQEILAQSVLAVSANY